MTDYFIQSRNNEVVANRIINGELEAIRINGDLRSTLSDFWPLFKQKIEYEIDEKLAVVVLTDNKQFEIDSEINIADYFVTQVEQLHALISENITTNEHLLSYPKLDINTDNFLPTLKTIVQLNKTKLEPVIEEVQGSLQSFFKKKTREIERENNKVTGGK